MHGASRYLSSPNRFALRAGLLGVGLVLAAAGSAAAGDVGVQCVLGSRASPPMVIAACGGIIDNDAASRPDRAAALVARADARAGISGGMSQALADLDRAVALDGRNATAYRLRGSLTREAGGNLEKAAADLSQAIALDPQDAEAYEQRGTVYTSQRKLASALADYDQVIRLKPDDAQAFSDRGVTFYLGGDNDKAVRDYDIALRLDPNRPRTYINRAAAYKKLGQLDKSLADENEAIRRDPKVPEYFDNRGLTFAAMADYDMAIADYDQAIRMEQRANFFTNRGDSYQYKGELGTALNDYDTALRLDPNFALAYNNRAVLYKKMGEGAGRLRGGAAPRSRQRECRQRPPHHEVGDRTIRRRCAASAECARPRSLVRLPDGQPCGGEGDLRRAKTRRPRPSDRQRVCQPDESQRRALRRCVASRPAQLHRGAQRRIRPAGL
jgi:tetratricopeptide (TPR) repeat protein